MFSISQHDRPVSPPRLFDSFQSNPSAVGPVLNLGHTFLTDKYTIFFVIPSILSQTGIWPADLTGQT